MGKRRPPNPHAAKRATLTKRERIKRYNDQGGLCGCGCGERLLSWKGCDAVGEHEYDFVALGCAAKPDKLYLPACAKRKTNGPRGDLNKIAHVRRLAEGRTQADKRKEAGGTRIPARRLESQGFWKGLFKKKVDGTVVPR